MKKLRIAAGLLLVAAAISLWSVPQIGQNRSFSLQFLNIGQGDATLIRTADDIRILIDGGPGDAILPELGRALPFFDKRIDLVILTHPDADHLEGLIPVLNRYKVDTFLWPGTERETAAFISLKEALEKKNIKAEKILAGDVITTSDNTLLKILWPLSPGKGDKTNESSIVAQLSFQDYQFLLTGDIGQESENQIITLIAPENLQSEVLKVPHHGSRYSSSPSFLQTVKPRISVISVGEKNFYGHPAPQVLQNLNNVNSEIFRTDLHGKVKFIIKEKSMIVKTEK